MGSGASSHRNSHSGDDEMVVTSSDQLNSRRDLMDGSDYDSFNQDGNTFKEFQRESSQRITFKSSRINKDNTMTSSSPSPPSRQNSYIPTSDKSKPMSTTNTAENTEESSHRSRSKSTKRSVTPISTHMNMIPITTPQIRNHSIANQMTSSNTSPLKGRSIHLPPPTMNAKDGYPHPTISTSTSYDTTSTINTVNTNNNNNNNGQIVRLPTNMSKTPMSVQSSTGIPRKTVFPAVSHVTNSTSISTDTTNTYMTRSSAATTDITTVTMNTMLPSTGNSTALPNLLGPNPNTINIPGPRMNMNNFTVKETNAVKRNHASLPSTMIHAPPTTGDWLNNRYIVNNFILLDVLGHGSYAEVRMCKDRNNESIYAMKIISKDFLRKKKSGATSETYFEDIRREIAIMKKLLHPNVLRLFEVLDDPKVNKLYLVLEYMKKGDLFKLLQDRIKANNTNNNSNNNNSTTTAASSSTSPNNPHQSQHNPSIGPGGLPMSNNKGISQSVLKINHDISSHNLNESNTDSNVSPINTRNGTSNTKNITLFSDIEIWSIFRQVVAGLRYLHQQNVVHGDIKPQNLLIGENGILKIADFGISRMLQGEEDVVEGLGGTPAFMSPELCSGQKSVSGQLADVWALGATIYMLLFGNPPYVAGNVLLLHHKIQNDPLLFPTHIPIDPNLKDLIEWMLKKDVTIRYSLTQVAGHQWLRQYPRFNRYIPPPNIMNKMTSYHQLGDSNTRDNSVNSVNTNSHHNSTVSLNKPSTNSTNGLQKSEPTTPKSLSTRQQSGMNNQHHHNMLNKSTKELGNSPLLGNIIIDKDNDEILNMFRPPDTYQEEEENAMKNNVIGEISNNELFMSIGVGYNQTYGGGVDHQPINSITNSLEEVVKSSLLHESKVEESKYIENNDTLSAERTTHIIEPGVGSFHKELQQEQELHVDVDDNIMSTDWGKDVFEMVQDDGHGDDHSDDDDVSSHNSSSSSSSDSNSDDDENDNHGIIVVNTDGDGMDALVSNKANKIIPQHMRIGGSSTTYERPLDSIRESKDNSSTSILSNYHASQQEMKESNTSISPTKMTSPPPYIARVISDDTSSVETNPSPHGLDTTKSTANNQYGGTNIPLKVMTKEEEDMRSKRFQNIHNTVSMRYKDPLVIDNQRRKSINSTTISISESSLVKTDSDYNSVKDSTPSHDGDITTTPMIKDNTIYSPKGQYINNHIVDFCDTPSTNSYQNSSPTRRFFSSSHDIHTPINHTRISSKCSTPAIYYSHGRKSAYSVDGDNDLEDVNEINMDAFAAMMDTLTLQPHHRKNIEDEEDDDDNDNDDNDDDMEDGLNLGSSDVDTDDDEDDVSEDDDDDDDDDDDSTSSSDKKSPKNQKKVHHKKLKRHSIHSDKHLYITKLRHKYHGHNDNTNIFVSVYNDIGVRETQEDRYLLIPDLSRHMDTVSMITHETPQQLYRTLRHMSILSIFDGHSGTTTADFLTTHFISHLLKVIFKYFDINTCTWNTSLALLQIFQELDELILKKLMDKDCQSGSTAIVAIYEGHLDRFTVANVGDSIAVICTLDNEVLPLVEMHRISNENERKRIENSGGIIINNRVNGILALTRAFGDTQFRNISTKNQSSPMHTMTPKSSFQQHKSNQQQQQPFNVHVYDQSTSASSSSSMHSNHSNHHNDIIIAKPEIQVTESITKKAKFVVLASDGLWDVMSPELVIKYILKLQMKGIKLSNIASYVVKKAFQRGSIDNVTVSILFFNASTSTATSAVSNSHGIKKETKV